jgi:type IV secretory pathway TrbL component
MDVIFASLISIKVIIYQFVLGGIQLAGFKMGGKLGLLVGYIIVLLWTLSKTYNSLFILQLIVQSAIGIYLLNSIDEQH